TGAEQVQVTAGQHVVQNQGAGGLAADDDVVAFLDMLQARGQRAIRYLDAVELHGVFVVRAGDTVGAHQRTTIDFQANHDEMTVLEAQTRITGSLEAEQGIGPVVDTEDTFGSEFGHPGGSPVGMISNCSHSTVQLIDRLNDLFYFAYPGKPIMKYTLRQLEVFLATAFHENLTRAADSLAMSQSAASSALRDLESQFEVQLFDRVGKRLQLNELGRSIRPRAQALLEQAN